MIILTQEMFFEAAGTLGPFLKEMDKYLRAREFQARIEEKPALKCTYLNPATKRAVTNFALKAGGSAAHIYGDNAAKYADFLQALPEDMLKSIRKGVKCKRLADPDACNPKCIMGYEFVLDGETKQKCRYMNFKFTMTHENLAYIRGLIERECEVKTPKP